MSENICKKKNKNENNFWLYEKLLGIRKISKLFEENINLY